MGVRWLQTFLRKDAPNEYCWEVDVKELADEYRNETGREPVVLVDGQSCFRSPCLCSCETEELLLGGQMQEFINTMKNFVAAFKNIGVRVVFFFDGMTQESKRDTWLCRRPCRINKVVQIFTKLDNKIEVTSEHLRGMLPPLVAATGHFVAKYVCGCDVHISVYDCDVEMTCFAQKEGCFAILSRDTDFVILQGAHYVLSAQHLNLETMTTLTYSRDGLLKALGLKPQQLFLLASLLGNDELIFLKLKNFHKNFTRNQNIFELLPGVVDYIKKWHFSDSYDDEELRKIAKDVFDDENMANDLSASIRMYLTPSTEVQEGTTVDNTQDENWQQILELAEEKHRSCQATIYLYNVILRKAYEMAESLEDYNRIDDLVPVAKIYQPLRQRIYGVLFYEKPTVTAVKEWCVDSARIPSEPTDVQVTRFHNIEKFHPGLLKLWDDMCEPNTRWCLFAESLTQRKKLDAKALQKLCLPYVVPVAVLFYLLNEFEGLINEADVNVILAQAALVKFCSPEDLKAITYQRIEPNVIHLSTIFNRGVQTVLFLLSACGFDIKEAMPWLYFDGKLFQQKYIQQKKRRITHEQLCDDKRDALRTFTEMKRLVLPPISWR